MDAVARPILTVHCANMLPGKLQMASEYSEGQFFQSYQFLWNWLFVVTYLVEIIYIVKPDFAIGEASW